MNFINLSNGLLAIREHRLADYRFVKISSTWCEQKRWGDILTAISDDFLMYAAQGEPCVVYDYGARKRVPRAVWQGLEWIKYALYRNWLDVELPPTGRAASMLLYFRRQYAALPHRVRQRIRYYRQFLKGRPDIRAVTNSTPFDGIVLDHLKTLVPVILPYLQSQ